MKKKFHYLIFLLSILSFKGLTQTNPDNYSLPKEYEGQFRKEMTKYLEFMSTIEDSANKAYNFWWNVKKGYLKNYNIDSLYDVVSKLKEKNLAKIIEFIQLNRGSYVSLQYFTLRLLYSTEIAPDSLFQVYNVMSKDLQNTPLGKSAYESLKRRQSLLLYHQMPNFSFKINNGQETNLAACYHQKYILLCFWASWCGPCVQNIPFLKKIDENYKNKGLQIISVSIDNDSTKWLGAVEKYRMPWYQTCDLPDYVQPSTRDLYQIQFIPQYFLIDKSGKLIYQDFLSNDSEDYDVLKDILHRELE